MTREARRRVTDQQAESEEGRGLLRAPFINLIVL